MKIVCVSTSQVPSDRANSIQVMKVCQALAQLGHDVRLLVPDDGQVSTKKRGWASLAYHYGLTTPFSIEWLALSRLWNRRGFNWDAVRRSKTLGAGLIYTRSTPAAVMGLMHGMPVALEIHHLPSGRVGPLWYRLFLALPGRKRLLPLTHALLELLNSRYPSRLRAAQVLVAPSGVDLERFVGLPEPEKARRQLDLASGATVACTGHMYAGRGTSMFLQLAARMPQVNFLWVGGRSKDIQAWRSRASADGIKNLTFTGFIPNQRVPLYQAAADVLLLPYQKSVAISSGGDTANVFSSLKMFEYMAAGRAILASDLPVVREILHESMAVFCPPDDLAVWIEALRGLLADKRRRRTLGENAQREVMNYTWLERSRRCLDYFLDMRT